MWSLLVHATQHASVCRIPLANLHRCVGPKRVAAKHTTADCCEANSLELLPGGRAVEPMPVPPDPKATASGAVVLCDGSGRGAG